MDKTTFDVKLHGNGLVQVEAETVDEAKKLGLVAYRKISGLNECLDFHSADEIVVSVTPSKKESMQYV